MNMKLISWLVGFAADRRGFLSIEVPTLTATLIIAIGIITGLIIGFAPTARDALGSHFVDEANAYAEGCDRKCRKAERKASKKRDWEEACRAVPNEICWSGDQRLMDKPSGWDDLTGKQQKALTDWISQRLISSQNLKTLFNGNRGNGGAWGFENDGSTTRICYSTSHCWWQ